MSLNVSEYKPKPVDDHIPEFGDNIKDENVTSAQPSEDVPF